MKYIQIFLEFQDIYSKNFNFLFDGKYKFHNKSGIYFSLFFNCFGIFLSIFFFKNEFFDYRPLTFKEIIPFHLSSNKLFIEKSSLLFFFSFYSKFYLIIKNYPFYNSDNIFSFLHQAFQQ